MIEQTKFGALLCWLGLHLIITSGENRDELGRTVSAWGGCIRCNKHWQWDNPEF